jgi:ActR/RegA family two-component response regulator
MKSKTKVLYVEDDKDWQGIVREGIASLECQLDIASTSKEAISRLRRSTYHVALLDKRLDEADPENDQGLTLATVIAGLDEGTKIVVFTAYGNIEDAREAFREIKVWDFIGKDKPISEIRRAIKEAGEGAILEFNRPARMSRDILAVKGNAPDQFLSGFPLKPGLSTNVQTLEYFAKRLLGEYRPLLPDRSDAKLLNLSNVPILQVRYWSKISEIPIAAWIGKYGEMKTALQNIENDESLRSLMKLNGKAGELFDPIGFPDFGGAVFDLKDVEFEEFESKLEIQS